MELGKYIRAMRPKKYLTREFKVYDASMADENTIDTMSTDAPPMDNVMPYTDGLEDPRNRQLELADGGIVEREGFNKGSEAKELRKLIESDKDKFTKKFNPFLKKYFPANLEKASEYLNIKSPRIRGLHKRRNIPLDTNRKKLSRKFVEGGMDVRGFRKEMATDLNFKEKIVKKLGSDSGYVDVNELGRKFGINLKEKKQKDYFLLVLKKLNIKTKPNPGQAQSKLYQVSDSVKKIIKNPVQKISGITKSGSERIVSEKKLDPDLFKFRNTLKQITREVTDKEGYKLDTKTGEKAQRIEDVGHSVSLKEATKYPKLFKNSNTLSLQSLIYQDPKLNRDILSKLGIDSSYSKIFKELNSFVGKKITPEDQKTIRQLNKDMSDIRNRAVKIIQEEAKREPYFVGQEKRIPLIKADIPKVGSAFKSENLKADMSVVDEYYRFGQPNQINPNVNKFKDFTETEKLQYVENSSKQNADNVAKFFANVTDERTGRPVVPMNELNELKFALETEINDNLKQYIKPVVVPKNFTNNEEVVTKKMNTLISNIGCPTGTLKASEGANCYIKGVEKIKTNNLNQNEFNILRKAVNSPAAQIVLKYGKGALKVLGPILTPLVAYDTFKSYKEGKPAFEILEEGLIGTGLARGIREAQTYTPEEREAIAQKKQYAREEEDYSGLSSDFNIPSNMSTDQIDLLSVTGPKRVEEKLAAEDAARAAERVYEGDPGFISETGYDVEERTGFKKGSKDKDSPVVPISPLTDLPQNESRRDFLKGIGAVGLGAVALGSGLLKLRKSLKTKEALSLLGKEAVGQPEWFAPLVDKIILKGIRLEKDGKKLDSYVLQEGDKTLTLNKNPYGTIEVDVQGGGAYDDTFTLRYNNSIGKNMYGEPTEFRDFKIIESRPKYQVSGMDESGFDYDLEPTEEYFSGKNLLKLEKNATGILSDVEGLEKIATGKIKDPKLAKTREQVRKKLIKIPAEDRIIENYDYEYDIDIPHEYND
jgi:hypothetical protein